MASANSFIQGFTGGMGAMSNLIDAKARRDALALQTQWAQEDRQYRQEERQYQQKERDNVQYLRNASATLEIYKSLETPEQQSAFTSRMFEDLNNDKDFGPQLNAGLPEGHNRKLSELKPTKNGYVPIFKTFDSQGQLLDTSPLRNEQGQPQVLSPDRFGLMLGSMPKVVDRATAARAQILSRGGKLPEKEARFRTKEQSGMLLKENMDSGETSLIGYLDRYGQGGKSGKSGSSGSGSSKDWRDPRNWRYISENKDPTAGSFRALAYDPKTQKTYLVDGDDQQKFHTREVTGMPGGLGVAAPPASLDSDYERLMGGGTPAPGGATAAPEPAPAPAPATTRNPAGTGVLTPETLQQSSSTPVTAGGVASSADSGSQSASVGRKEALLNRLVSDGKGFGRNEAQKLIRENWSKHQLNAKQQRERDIKESRKKALVMMRDKRDAEILSEARKISDPDKLKAYLNQFDEETLQRIFGESTHRGMQ